MAALARCPVKGIVGYGPSKLRYKLLPDHNIKLSDRKLILDILNTDFHGILM